MAAKCMVYIATSLDGYISRLDGSIDWLTEYPSHSPAEDYGYTAFMHNVDAMVIGRKTYELAIGFPQWPYQGKRVVVLTSRNIDLPQSIRNSITTTSDTPEQIVNALERSGYVNIYVDGGQTIQSFLRAGFIQEITITRIPKLIGTGISLFGSIERDIELHHVSTETFENGFVQSTYSVLKTAS